MSDLEKTAQVVYESCYGRNLHPGQVSSIVRGLNDAGLLAPDLPEPDVIRPGNRTKSWFDENIYAHEGSGKVRVIADDVFFTVDDAREHALSVLAACEYAEKEQDNER